MCVFDRYAYSLAYQLARGARLETVRRVFERLPRPDVLIFLYGGSAENAVASIVMHWYMRLIEMYPPATLVVDEGWLRYAKSV